MTFDLDDIDDKIEDAIQAIILLNSFPYKYKYLKFGIMYRSDILTFDFVLSNLRSKDLDIKVYDKGTISNSLLVRGRFVKRGKGSVGKSNGRFLDQRSMKHIIFCKK